MLLKRKACPSCPNDILKTLPNVKSMMIVSGTELLRSKIKLKHAMHLLIISRKMRLIINLSEKIVQETGCMNVSCINSKKFHFFQVSTTSPNSLFTFLSTMCYYPITDSESTIFPENSQRLAERKFYDAMNC